MPDISRSSVDLPAPLCPTSATLSPLRSETVMSRNASMIGTFDSVPIRPPALPSTAFFSERVFASKIGKSTAAPSMSMLTMRSSDPVRDAGAVVAQADQRGEDPDHGDADDDVPVVPDDRLAEQRLAQDLDEVQHRVDLGDPRAPRDGRVAQQRVVLPDDRRHEEQQLGEARDDRRDVPEA